MDLAYYLKKKGLPAEDDIVLCTVKKVIPHSVFVYLDEYSNVEAMIHISEIAPGRIRNIRDYVKEGKKLVCKVLRSDPVRRQVDLSLRRVPQMVKNKKMDEHKEEQKAGKIMEHLAQQFKVDINEIYTAVGKSIVDEYGILYPFFQQAAVEGMPLLKKLKVPDKYAQALLDIVQDRIKPKEVAIEGTFTLTSYEPNGVGIIKQALLDGVEKVKNQCKIRLTYLGAPRYKLEVMANDYKVAEQNLKVIMDSVLSSMKGAKNSAEFSRK